MPDATLVLAQQFREAGANDQYCDWLSARAFEAMGAPTSARRMLTAVTLTDVVDTSGFRVCAARPQSLHRLGKSLTGRPGHRLDL